MLIGVNVTKEEGEEVQHIDGGILPSRVANSHNIKNSICDLV
jgi:hypothetical protein